jgi:large subunit ribosomal protein L25
MDTFKLSSEVREASRKGHARKLRAEGRIPAILYGHKKTPVSLSVEEAQMRAILSKHPDSPIVDLSVGDGGEINALVREIQRHPATGRLLHIDFQRIRLDEQVRVDVPIELIGEPIGVKDQGGILEHGIRSLTVECLPREIPESIDIDVRELSIGDAVKLEDIQARYPKLEFADEPELTLATVSPPRLEAVEEPEEALEGEEAEPEVISKEKEGEAPAEEDSEES